MGGRPFLEVDGVGKAFRRQSVLTNASYGARRGRVTALLGSNGAGKTTLFRITVGRLRCDYGRVFYRGRLRERPRLAELALEGLFYSSQELALTPNFTVGEHLRAFARRYRGDAESGVGEVAERMSLTEYLDRRSGRISGGERKRAALALALLREADCVLLDEPFAGVAPKDRPLMARGIRRLRDSGAAVVVTGHDVEDLFGVSDEIIWVVAGTTHWLGPPEEAARHDQFRREYLGPRLDESWEATT